MYSKYECKCQQVLEKARIQNRKESSKFNWKPKEIFLPFHIWKKIIENSSPKKLKKKMLSKPICKREKKIVRPELYMGLSLSNHEILSERQLPNNTQEVFSV